MPVYYLFTNLAYTYAIFQKLNGNYYFPPNKEFTSIHTYFQAIAYQMGLQMRLVRVFGGEALVTDVARVGTLPVVQVHVFHQQGLGAGSKKKYESHTTGQPYKL